MATVTYQDLEAAFDFVSSGAPCEHEAFVCLDSGAIYWVLEDEELPEDLDTSDRYIAVPHKNDLDLGRELALRFADEHLPRRYSQVEECFRHRGAYARFKELLAAAGQLEAWYAFEAHHTERALREWCAENDLDVTGRSSEPPLPRSESVGAGAARGAEELRPEIARFFGIVIRMLVEPGGPHNRPHFHAYYQDAAAVFAIDTLELIGGSLPRKEQRLVEAWGEIHLTELDEDWRRLQEGQPTFTIEPLK